MFLYNVQKIKLFCQLQVKRWRDFMVELDQYKYTLAGYKQAVEEIGNSL